MLSSGERFYAEQVSHHPPITNFQLVGPDNLYEYSGFFEYKVWLSGLSSIGGSRTGKEILTFKDGGLLSIKDPMMEVTGMAYGERVHSYIGQAIIRDHINMIEAEIIYNPEKPKSYFSSFKSKIVGSGNKLPTDSIEVNIYQPSKSGQRKVFATG